VTVLATDDFNRASLGSNWTTMTSMTALSTTGSIEVVATADPSGSRYNAVTPSSADYYVQMRAETISTSGLSGLGPMMRASSSAATAYFYHGSTSDSELVKISNNTYSQLASGAAIATNDVLYIECVGAGDIQCKKNGANTLSSPDSVITDTGFGGAWGGNVGGTNPTGDDWEMGDFLSGSSSGPVGLISQRNRRHVGRAM
jgi:hypothetical protein